MFNLCFKQYSYWKFVFLWFSLYYNLSNSSFNSGFRSYFKRDTSFETKYLVFLAPLIFAYLLMYLGIESIESTTLVYVLFLMYAIYLNHLNEVKVSYENQGFSFNFGREVNRTLLLTVFSMVSIPILILYILYVQYPNVLSDARSQCSILIGFSGIMLLIYNLKKVNDWVNQEFPLLF